MRSRVDRIDPRLSTAKAQATLALANDVPGTVRPSAADVASEKVVRALLHRAVANYQRDTRNSVDCSPTAATTSPVA